jgi:predicted transcriptional regulator
MAETLWPTSVRLTTKVKLALDAAVVKMDRKQAWIINRALTEFLEREGYLSDKSGDDSPGETG